MSRKKLKEYFPAYQKVADKCFICGTQLNFKKMEEKLKKGKYTIKSVILPLPTVNCQRCKYPFHMCDKCFLSKKPEKIIEKLLSDFKCPACEWNWSPDYKAFREHQR